jgi:7-carboxy-7-deazaguanine synthase
MYSVKEIFPTLQGEGANAGAPAVFLRFAGCNLWPGRERHRASAVCRFCDTDFVGTEGDGGGKFAGAEELARAVEGKWLQGPGSRGISARLVVCTGGEPLLQLDDELVGALHGRGFRIALETNGTLVPPPGIDWICVSPKANAALAIRRGDELKLVYPQEGAEPERYAQLEFGHFFLQPMDGPYRAEYTRLAAQYCLRHPRWGLSLQIHKLIGMR